MPMKVSIKCKCGAKFEIRAKYADTNEIVCQNCGLKFPDELTKNLRKMLNGYNALMSENSKTNSYVFDILFD
jgi:DNA-directed RNA polymerase subunit RPC12/RpoP